MPRLRIRIELSRGGAGVPLRKLASVIAESQKFLNLLTEDVRLDQQKGEWLGFDFDSESLNFTAEYVGPVTSPQVEAFNAAFDGTTSLRRDTIGQFLRITESIGEDEIIGFGLYQSEDVAEPTEWRCLSRRDALRIADEVQILIGSSLETHLPSVGDPALGARMFGDRRERNLADAHRLDHGRTVESGLATRVERLEGQVEKHSGLIQDLRQKSTATETSFLNLLSTFEKFCDQATHKIERMSPLALPAASVVMPRPAPGRRIALAVFGFVALVMTGAWLWPVSHQASSIEKASIKPKPEPPVAAAAVPIAPATPAAPIAPVVKPVSAAQTMQLDLEATEPSWISLTEDEGNTLLSQLLTPGTSKTVVLHKSSVLRVGNAGGVVVHLNGQPIGPIGPGGQVRDVQFRHGGFTIRPPG